MWPRMFRRTGFFIGLLPKKRLDDIDARGVVIGPDQKLGDLYAERQPLYAKYADITISTDGLSPDLVVSQVINSLKKAGA